MRYLVVTGVSSGLGEAFAEVALDDEPGSTVIGVSRRGNPRLERRANDRGSAYYDYRFDLSRVSELGDFCGRLFERLRDDDEVLLVNNAAVEGPLGSIERLDRSGVIDHIGLNLTACMLLSGAFIAHTEGWSAKRAIINITSGAARHPYDGMSAYCATKAGLDMFGRCVAMEQRTEANPVRILAVAPGVLDTPMQERVRATDPLLFRSRERFVALKRDGKLTAPADAARRILSLAFDQSHENGAVLDLRELS